jgi:hypothetical protein
MIKSISGYNILHKFDMRITLYFRENRSFCIDKIRHRIYNHKIKK